MAEQELSKRKRRRSRASRFRTRLCKEGAYQLVIMAFLLVAALIRQINLLLLIFSGLAVPLLWNLYFVRSSLKKLSFRRLAPEFCSAGDRIVIDIECTNERDRRNSWVVVATDILRLVNPDESRRLIAARPIEASTVFSRIKPGETVRESYEGRLTQRGEYRLGPLQVSTRFPLGLIKRSFRYRLPQTIIVHPRLGKLTRAWRENSQRSFQGGISVAQQVGVVEAEFHGLREYRSGDSKNWIHWKTTARRGEPIVRQFEQQRNLDMVIVLDLWIPQYPRLQDLETVEIAVSFAATLLSTQAKRGLGNLVLATHHHEPKTLRGVASHGLVREALTDLALARCSREDHLPELLSKGVGQPAARQGEIVVISTRYNDLNDVERFADVGSSSMRDDWRRRVTYVNCARPEFSQLFEPPHSIDDDQQSTLQLPDSGFASKQLQEQQRGRGKKHRRVVSGKS